MSDGRGDGPAQDLQNAYSNYKVYDHHYNEIGKVDDIFVDENDQPEYIGVKMGFLGLKSTVVPMEMVRVNEKRGLIEVAESEDFIKNGPSFDDDEVISPEHESEILRYYGLERSSQNQEPRAGYAAGGPSVDSDYDRRSETPDRRTYEEEPRQSYREDPIPERPARESAREPRDEPAREPAREPERSAKESVREFRDEPVREPTRREPTRGESTRGESAREVHNENEVRVQRTEEELRASVREREAGSVNVRKRIRTDREQIRVPRRHEEVSVERVPVEEQSASATGGTAPKIESTEGEIRVPIVEEEIVVEKKPVVKEEIRIRKDMVEEEEVVEADVRKEEIEVEDETRRR